jgi:hypothetical protein
VRIFDSHALRRWFANDCSSAVELDVGGGHQQQRQEQAERLRADDRDGDGRALGAANADAERGGEQPEDDRECRHQNRAEPRAARVHDRLVARHSTRAQDVGVVDLENRVLFHDAEQEQNPERAPQVQRPPGRQDREQRERDRQRQHGHDDERLHEALDWAASTM